MASSIGDKARILDWVLPGHAVDVGAGGGELAEVLAGRAEVTAIDASPDSLARLLARDSFHVVDATVGADTAPLAPVADTVVFSSILHEVYSYSPDRFGAGHRALDQAVATLRPGGNLIIRDGVMPDNPEAPARFRAPDDALVREYLALTPHRELQLTYRRGWWEGTRHAVAEAALTLTWGRDALPREAMERYQLVSDYTPLLVARGLTMLHASTVTQPGYVEGLAEYTIESMGHPWFPDTNGLWVAAT